MLSVTFAFVVATALLFLFASTRALGVVGVFILLCLNPLLFGGLLVLAGIAYWLSFRRTCRPPSSGKGGILPLLAALGIGGLLAFAYSEPTSDGLASRILGGPRSAPGDEVIVLRTPGGLLEVADVHTTEIFDATVTHSLFGVNIGETMPRIRLPAVYRYHVELAPEWRVVRADGVFTVVAPRIKPTLPVAVDFEGVRKDVAGSWILQPFTGVKDLDVLERSITRTLERKALSRDYIDRQREAARDTVREFVRKWLVEQTRWKSARYEDVRVLFEDEPAGYIAPMSG